MHVAKGLLLFAELQGRFRRRGVRVNNWDHLMSWLSPACRGNHTPWWTFFFTAVILVIFFFMAGLISFLHIFSHVCDWICIHRLLIAFVFDVGQNGSWWSVAILLLLNADKFPIKLLACSLSATSAGNELLVYWCLLLHVHF